MTERRKYLISGLLIREGQKIKIKNAHIFVEEMCQLYYPGKNDVSDRRLVSGDIGILKKLPMSHLGRPVFVIEIDGLETDFLWIYEELYDLKEHLEVIDEGD